MSLYPRVNLRRLATLGTGHTPSRHHPEYWEDCTIPWLTLADVWQLRDGTKSVVTETEEKISETGVANSSARVHPAGTVAMSRTASVGFTCLLGADMATSQDFVTWTCGPHLHPRFLLHSLRGQHDEILSMRMGSTHQTIYMPDVERIRTPLPSLEEQRKIVNFLDAETVRIDSLIAKKRRLIEALDEMQMSVMTDGVQGILTATDRVPAGVPWIESRGSDWREPKLTFVATLGTGHTPSRNRPEWWIDCTIPWVTTGEVAQMRSDRIEFLSDTREAISQIGVQNSSAEVHPAGTVVLCRTAASAGYSAIMGRDMATSQDIVTWTCGPLLRPRFLLLCLRVMRQDLLGRLAIGSTHKTIYMPDIESLRVVLPPVSDQDRIVDEVWRRLTSIHKAMDLTARQVDLLVEHRQALITAAVTGELTVPGAAA